MISIKKYFQLGFRKSYGLLISDTDVVLLSWRKGVLERLAVFGNDDAGVERFHSFLERNADMFKSAAFSVLTNIIGEDYRVERVAHLLGKYKTDFHARRMHQLFRGSPLSLSITQGREERGRREDIVLFYGILTEGKVMPWINMLTRDPERYLVGVYSVSLVTTNLISAVVGGGWREGNRIFMTLHEKGLLRQTFFGNGHLRFSRVSKIKDESVEDIADSLKKELERTIQYLNSLKISVAGGLSIDFVCPSNMVGQLRELLKSGDRIKFFFHDAGNVAQQIGLKSSLEEVGKDSSLALQGVFSYIYFHQLISLDRVRYYWMRAVANAAVVVFALYAAFGLLGSSLVFLDGYQLASSNAQEKAERDSLKSTYDSQIASAESPPSSPENISALTRTFEYLSRLEVSPGQLIYYFANSFSNSKKVSIDRVHWYLTDNAASTSGDIRALFTGNDVFQILEVSGRFDPIPNETYIDVARRAENFIASFESRSDILIEAVRLPTSDISQDISSGTLDEDYDINAVRERDFRIRIIWKEYDRDLINQLSTEV